MDKNQETCPKMDNSFVLDKINFKVEPEDNMMNHSLERMDFKSEQQDVRQTDSSDEQAEFKGKSRSGRHPGKYSSPDNEEEYGSLFSQYSSTLYDVAMEAVAQSLLSSRNISSRKKSPAWNHFFISPRDSTKAICMYCMKEFSRG